MGYYKNYIKDEEYIWESLAQFYQQNEEVGRDEGEGRGEPVQGAVKPGAPAGVTVESTGLMLPLGRGHPKIKNGTAPYD